MATRMMVRVKRMDDVKRRQSEDVVGSDGVEVPEPADDE